MVELGKGDAAVEAEMAIYELSWQRIADQHGGRDHFFERFYESFIGLSEEVRALFQHTDMRRQQIILHDSFVHMATYAHDRKPTEYLEHLAYRHGKAGLNVPPCLYDTWLHALLMTVMDCDPGANREVLRAWEKIFAPGIDFMQSQFAVTPAPTPPSIPAVSGGLSETVLPDSPGRPRPETDPEA